MLNRNSSAGTAAPQSSRSSLIQRPAIILAMLLLVAVTGKSQVYVEPQPTNEPKVFYTHILVYRSWEQGYESGFNGGINIIKKWVTHSVGFQSLNEVIGWLNTTGWDGRPSVRISDNELIGIYDLSKAKQITVKLKTEQKSLPKRVEVQEEKWTEQRYEVSNGN